VGVILRHYKKPDVSLVIIPMALAPDIDYILQSMWDITAPLFGLFVRHGDFHCIVAAVLLPLLVAVILYKCLKLNFFYTFLCAIIGYSSHIIEDLAANQYYYYMFWPLNHKISVWGIATETGNFHGVGDLKIILFSITCILLAICLRNSIEGSNWINKYVDIFHPRKVWNVLITFIS
jgi:membrane-bound metal-dependent hydrolase YbcI (DUF457 family)